MRVLVCGSRHFNDYELLRRELNEIRFKDTDREFSTIIHGMARGADTLAGRYAEDNQIPVLEYPALWETYGRRAGPIRNTEMLRDGKPNLVVAFRGPNSRGTQNMINQSRKAGVKVIVIDVPTNEPEAVREGN